MRQFSYVMWRALLIFPVVAALIGASYFSVTAINSIRTSLREQATQEARDLLRQETATALAPTFQAQNDLLLAVQVTPSATATASPLNTLLPSATASPSETATPSPTITASTTATPTHTTLPSNTPTPSPSATSSPSATASPTDSPEPSPLPQIATLIPTLDPQALTQTRASREVAQVVTLIPTNTLRPTLIPTNTLRPSATVTLTPSLTPTLTLTPTPTPTFTPTLTPTNTATYTPTSTPTATFTPSFTPTPSPSPYPIEGTYATPVTTPIIAFPPRAPLAEDDPNIVHIVLLGSDARGDSIGRTDVFILVSINKTAGSAAMWHIPRDLLVYIPGNTVDRINRAYPIGALEGWPTGGAGLVKEAILYNFGIFVDYYARVDFNDFEQIIKSLGGLEISVDCQLEDWALISPDADPTLEESYERYTLRIGRQRLSPYYALWYARSRVTTSDLDRGRRQMDILRAIFTQARNSGLLNQATQLLPELLQIVDTDMSIEDMLGFLPLATTLELSAIERYSGAIGKHYENFTTPDDGRAVLIPKMDAIQRLVQDFVTPPTGNRVERSAFTVEVVDASYFGIGFDVVAAERLAWEGLRAYPASTPYNGSRRDATLVYDYTGETKGGALERILETLRISPQNVIVQPDPNRTVDYRIEIGTAYNSCLISSSADDLSDILATPSAPTPTLDPNVTPATVG